MKVADDVRSEKSIERLVNMSQNCTGADIDSICMKAGLEAIQSDPNCPVRRSSLQHIFLCLIQFLFIRKYPLLPLKRCYRRLYRQSLRSRSNVTKTCSAPISRRHWRKRTNFSL